MANIIDYIRWRGDLSTIASPFNDIDSLILSQISMINFKGIIPPPFESGKISLADAAELYFSDEDRSSCSLGAIIPPETKELFMLAGTSKRFGEMVFSGYVSYTNVDSETQFAALTVGLEDGAHCIIFRGTDDSLVGWKEDFNLSFLSPIPAQTEALKYLEDMSTIFEGSILLGGHSKGGNLAVYAATKADVEIQDRIVAVYNHDAPGFSREFLSSPEHERIEGKIKTVVPQSSVVGMLFENKGNYEIVKSNMSGILQHNPFSWEIVGKEFVKLDSLTEEGQRIAKVMNDWMSSATIEERQNFVDALYKILLATEATTLSELYADKYAVVRAVKDADKETRNMVFSVLGILFEEGGRIFRENLFGNAKRKSKEGLTEETAAKQLEEAFADAQGVLAEMREGGEIPDIAAEEPVPVKPVPKPERIVKTVRVKHKKLPPQKRRRVNTTVPKQGDFISRLAFITRQAVLKKTQK